MLTFVRRYLLHNAGLKLLSLAMAVLLWLAVTRDPVTELAVSVPIEFHHVPENLEISSENIPQVQIRLRGPGRQVRELAQSQVHAVIDLAGARPGERTYDLTPREIHVPHEVEVVQVVPSQFRLSFDRRALRQVDVRARVTGTFASGYHIAQVYTTPEMVTVIGPQKRVDAIDAAITDPVDATGTVGKATFLTHAYVADPLVRIGRPEAIRVTVITEKAPERSGTK